MKKARTAFFTFSLIALLLFYAYAGEEDDFGKSKFLIKVDSAGLQATLLATGKGSPPEKSLMTGSEISAPQARAIAKKEAVTIACERLDRAVADIPVDFFPKERYLAEDGSIRGAQLDELRYYGDGSVEADVSLDIALVSKFTEKFEKEMRVAGYKVVEYDSSRREMAPEDYSPSN